MTTLGSFCTGVAGLDLAVAEHYNARPVWHSEVDPAACAVLEHRYPHVPNIGDVTLTRPFLWGPTAWDQVEPVDVLCAGYPCQPFSQAGQRKGTDDARHLWPHIAEAIRTLEPRIVVLENVRGHLSLGFDAVLADLARMGLHARWGVVRASDAGAPHRRARLFAVAHRASIRRQPWAGSRQSEPTRLRRPRPSDPRRAPTPDTDEHRCEGFAARGQQPQQSRRRHADRRGARRWGDYWPAIERWERITGRSAPNPLVRGRLNPRLSEWMMGLPAGWITDVVGHADALRCAGNAVCPQQAALALDLLDDLEAAA